MSWLDIAKKDFSDIIRSKKLWIIILIFSIVTMFSVYLPEMFLKEPTLVKNPEKIGFNTAFEFAKMLVPITALVASYLSITGEKESKSIKMLLGLGNTRSEIVFAKVISRTITVTIGIMIGFATSIILTLIVYNSTIINQLILIAILSAYLGFSYVGIAIGISEISNTRKRAAILSTTAFILLTILWREIPSIISMLLPGSGLASLKTIISVLSPTTAYNELGKIIFQMNPSYIESPIMSKYFLTTIIAAWGIIPILIGYVKFKKQDLN